MRKALLAAAFLATASWAIPASGAPDKSYANIHTIAVISALGNDVEMQTFGATRFGNAEYTLHADWNVDAQIADEVTKALSPRFAIRDAGIDPRVFGGIKMGPTDDEWSQVKNRIMALPRSSGIDAYVVVFPQFVDIMAWNGTV